MRLRGLSLAAVSSLIITSVLIGSLPVAQSAEIETVVVDSGTTRSLTLNLQRGASVSGSISVEGGSGNDIDFYITDPSGNQVVTERRVQRGTNFSFTANTGGAHTFYFDNSFSVFSDKQVNLTYDVQNPIIPGTTGGGGCLIATAAFGSELTPQVQFLRGFRDNHILSTTSGASFMTAFNAWYYSFSPYVADFEREQPWLQQTVKIAIYPLLGSLVVSEKAYGLLPGEYGSVAAGLIASSLIGAMYITPVTLSIKQVRKYHLDYRIAIIIITAVTVGVIVSLAIDNSLALTISASMLVLVTLGLAAVYSANTVARLFTRLQRSRE